MVMKRRIRDNHSAYAAPEDPAYDRTLRHALASRPRTQTKHRHTSRKASEGFLRSPQTISERKKLPEKSPLFLKSKLELQLLNLIFNEHKPTNIRKSSHFESKTLSLAKHDMENPLFRNYWNAPPPRFSTVPVRQQRRKPSHPSKIASIPVRFFESEKTRSEAATKIQKHFRGFAVRKNVKKIAKIRSEVVEIERRVSQKETKELIARDAKERLRLNETLMSLLFRLDSVRGIDSAVRDCRKAAIRRAIALQEAVDAITEKRETQMATDLAHSSGNSEPAPDSVDQAERAPEMQDFVAAGEHTSEIQHHARISDDCGKPSVNVDDRAQETKFPAEFSDYQDRECVQDPSESVAIDDCGNPSADDDDDDEQAQEMVQEDQSGSVAAFSECRNASVAVDEQALAIETADKSKEEKSSADVLVSVEEEEESQVEEGGEEEGRERNEKEKPRLRSMVTELRERNEEQRRMIGALWERVEQLERTVESMRRKKKRHHAEATGRRKCERRLWL